MKRRRLITAQGAMLFVFLSAAGALALLLLPGGLPRAPEPATAAPEFNDGLSDTCSTFNDTWTGNFPPGLGAILPDIPEPGWSQIDPGTPFRSAAGTVNDTDSVSYTDFDPIHDSHDLAFNITADKGQDSLISIANDPNPEEADVGDASELVPPTDLHLEWETGIRPDETTGDGAAPTFPKWAWPSKGDRVWANGVWIHDCGHPTKIGGVRHYRTELHPVRAIASMRDQFHILPGSGTTPVHVTATDLYIHGHSGFAPDDLACGPNVIVDPLGGCTTLPHRTEPIAANYQFSICMPLLPSEPAGDKALPMTFVEDGPGNTVTDPALKPQVTVVDVDYLKTDDPCTDTTKFGPKKAEVTVPLGGSNVTPDDFYARRIYAGWIYPPTNPHHLKVTLNSMVLLNDNDTDTLPIVPDVSGCECSFFWMTVDKSPNEWQRLSDFEVPTDYDGGAFCPSHTNTMDDFDDEDGCGNGLLNFNGLTYDFFVGDNKPVMISATGYDQDCFDKWMGNHDHNLLLNNEIDFVNGLILCVTDAAVITPFGQGACNFGIPGPADTDECDDNDNYARLETTLDAPGYGAGGGHDVPNPDGDYNLQFSVEDAPLGIEDSADLGLTKACKPDQTALAGVQFTCTILVTNPSGPGLPRNVVVDDTLLTDVNKDDYTLEPPTFTFGGQTGNVDDCITQDNPIEDIPGGKEFHCKIGTVPVGGKAIITMHITSNEGGDFNNFANVTTDSHDTNPNNNSDHDSVHVTSVADLGVAKSDAPDPLDNGTTLTYTLHLTNNGPSHAVNVVAEDFLPSGLKVVSVNGGPGVACTFGIPSDPTQPTTCNYATLAPAATADMTIVTTVLPGDHDVLQNTARIRSDTLDLNNSNNVASATTTIHVADLAITKTSDAASYKSSAQVTYTLNLVNNGPADAANVVISDDLPLLSKDRAFVFDNSCTLVGSHVTCNFGTLNPLASRSVIVAIVPKGSRGEISNTATVASSTFDPTTANNSSTRVVFSGNPPKP